MADRECATDQRQSDILANIQQAILNGPRYFETDDVDDSGILLKFRQCLRDLRIPDIAQDNARHIGEREPTLFQKLKWKIWICDITKSI